MKCCECPYLVKREKISLVSRTMGYTAECSRTGILFCLEHYNEAPRWCPLNESEKDPWDFIK